MPLVRGALFLYSLTLHVLVNFNISGTWILLPQSLQCLFLKKGAQEIAVWRFIFAKLDSFCNVWQERFNVH